MSANSGRRAAPRPPKPVERYWRGKLPKGIQDVADSDEEEHEVEEQGDTVEEDEELDELTSVPIAAERKPPTITVSVKASAINDLSRREETIQEEEEPEPQDQQPQSEQESSSEYESESEEEQQKPQFRPVFVPARKRATVAERTAEVQETEQAVKEQEAARKQASHNLVGDSIRRELESKEVEKPVIDVDDTDGLDPEGEFEEWRLRELGRIKRDKEEEVRMEREREEVERRRALPAEQREKEDMEHAKKLRDEKPKGQQKFLQKYWHKGAFHQDVDILKRHDFTEATESTLDVTILPKVMQKRDFGKRSQTKYTHLVDQDTTDRQSLFKDTGPKGKYGQPGGGIVCFICGGPHLKRDCPQFTPAMAASSNLRSRDQGWEQRGDRRHDGDRQRSRSRSRERDRGWNRPRSRSRSPSRREEKRVRIQ